MTNAIKPPPSYSMPSFRSGDYGNIDAQLDSLADLGFRWVTFTPTYSVTETHTVRYSTTYLRIPFVGVLLHRLFGNNKPTRIDRLILDESQSPIGELRNAVISAVTRGFSVKIEPHLDYASTLAGTGEKDWRMDMYFDPSNASTLPNGYYEKVLTPIMDVIREAAATAPPDLGKAPCFALTLGSELDVSLYSFAGGWETVKDRMKTRRTDLGLETPHRLSFGHKLNYDVFMPNGAVRRRMNIVRDRWGLDDLSANEINTSEQSALGYLRDLDYVSFSFYAPLDSHMQGAANFDWTREDDAAIDTVAKGFESFAKTLQKKLGTNVPMDIGEFGLGCGDTGHSYNDRPGDFVKKNPQTGSWETDEETRKKRRLFFKGMAKFMEKNKKMFKPHPDKECGCFLPATFWTVKQYDFLGIWDYPITFEVPSGEGAETVEVPHELFVDEELIEWIRACNERTFGSD